MLPGLEFRAYGLRPPLGVPQVGLIVGQLKQCASFPFSTRVFAEDQGSSIHYRGTIRLL